MEPVKTMTFRSEHMTEGKISINEDKATPIFPARSLWLIPRWVRKMRILAPTITSSGSGVLANIADL